MIPELLLFWTYFNEVCTLLERRMLFCVTLWENQRTVQLPQLSVRSDEAGTSLSVFGPHKQQPPLCGRLRRENCKTHHEAVVTHTYRVLSVKVKGVTEGFKLLCITLPHDLWACNLNSTQKSIGLFTWGPEQHYISLSLQTVDDFWRIAAVFFLNLCW